MRKKPLNTLDVLTAGHWRKWLAGHHDSVSEVWLVFHKRHTGRESIPYGDALDEALCFGWVDSLVRRLDDERYARKFTPRKPDSRWSTINRTRYARLAAEGRLEAAGVSRAPTENSDYPPRPPWSGKLPAYIRDALKQRPKAWSFFESLAPSYRRLYVGWIDSARRPETRLRRLREAIGLLAAGKKLGLK
jgi:uncharacterized protein YdeI (YjbR/CyaY-like superfamily)